MGTFLVLGHVDKVTLRSSVHSMFLCPQTRAGLAGPQLKQSDFRARSKTLSLCPRILLGKAWDSLHSRTQDTKKGTDKIVSWGLTQPSSEAGDTL